MKKNDKQIPAIDLANLKTVTGGAWAGTNWSQPAQQWSGAQSGSWNWAK